MAWQVDYFGFGHVEGQEVAFHQRVELVCMLANICGTNGAGSNVVRMSSTSNIDIGDSQCSGITIHP